MKRYIDWERLSSYLSRQIDKAEKDNNKSQMKFWHKVYGIMQDFADIEQEPKTDGDCISRTEAINAFPDLFSNVGYNKNCIEEVLQDLPSVNPQELKTGIE